MAEQLFYGDGRSLRLAWRHPIDVLWCAASRIAPVADARMAARRAVEAPIDYPPLSALLAPEDRIALAVEPGVPEATAIVRGVIDALTASGVQTGQIAVVRASPSTLDSGVREVLHRADDADTLAYLAATDDAYPIYLNRVLYDADIVIPIGLRRPNNSYGYLGSPGGLYPLFADDAARFRLLATSPADWRRHGRSRRWEADRVAWQLGVQFRIEAVPGPHGQLAQILGGQADSVARHARRTMLDIWGQRLSQQVGIAVAAVEQLPHRHLADAQPAGKQPAGKQRTGEQRTGDQRTGEQPTGMPGTGDIPANELLWNDIQRAFYTAARVVADDGVIVVCAGVKAPPQAVRRPARMAESTDESAAADEDASDSPLDRSSAAGRSERRSSRGGERGKERGKARGKIRGDKQGDGGRRLRADSPQAARVRRLELQPVRELLAELGESRRLYLLSDLPRDVVEDLGCMPVETADEIVLLARPFDTGIVIANAEYAHLSLAREADEQS